MDSFCLDLCGGVFAEDLHYRVTNQIENDRTGQNVFSSGVYTGELDFGYFVGDADFKYSTGSSYVGQWANNHMEGLGVLSVPSVGIYDGEFLHSEKNGTGIFTWEDGAVSTVCFGIMWRFVARAASYLLALSCLLSLHLKREKYL